VLRRVDGLAREVRIHVGAVSDVPTALSDVALEIEGNAITATSARAAGAAAAEDVDPAGSIHASAAYLRQLTGTLVERALLRAWERAG
jgi:CO/xanthine dehydrogenase FAD-binding subunit